MRPAVEAEQLDIAAERQQLISEFRSGDFTSQRHALERLSVLCENHFPDFLAASVLLIADANRLNDRMRQRTLRFEDQDVEIRKLVDGGMKLIASLMEATPTSRIPALLPPSDSASDHPAAAAAPSPAAPPAAASEPASGNEDALTRFIIQSQEPKSKGELIVAQDITKAFANSQFKLRPISLELFRGEILGIVGINASGKTTLLRLLLGDLAADGGELFYPSFGFDGPDKRKDWLKIKRRIAYVSQAPPSWPGLIYDNLFYTASVCGHRQSAIDAHLDILLKRYGLDRFRNARWNQLSAGYKTRFELVRALLSNPDIIILDEPLAYLDIITQELVLRQLHQLSRNRVRPIGIALTSQQLYEVERIADRLLVLDGGNTVFSGRVDELSTTIDCLVVEFVSNEEINSIKRRLGAAPNFRSLFASETGLIAIFAKNEQGRGDRSFNDALQMITAEGSGQLKYVRDISASARLLFEPELYGLLGTARN